MSGTEREATRREFIKYAGATIAGLVAGGVLGYSVRPVERVAATETVTVLRTVTAAPSPREILELSHWTWNTKIMEETFKITGALDRFGVKVSIESLTTGQVYDRLTTAAAAGTGAPDWVLIENEFVPRFASIGILRNLEDLGADEFAKYFPKWWVDSGRYKGKIYGMPWDIGPMGIFYRIDLFEKYGLEPLKPGMTWDDVVEIARQFLKTEGAKEHVFMSFPTNDRGPLTGLIQSVEGKIFERTADGKVKCVIDTGEALEVIKFVSQLRDEKMITMEPWWTDEWYGKVADGYYLAIPAGQWFGGFLRDWLAPKSVGLWRATSLPYWEKGKPTGGDYGGSCFCITTQTYDEKAQRAWELIKFLTIDLEGVHALYKTSGYFPAHQEYLDIIKGITEPYFGGQKWLEPFVEEVKYIPTLDYTEFWTHYTGHVGALLERIAAGEDPVTVVKDVASIINGEIAGR
ncbi:MAG: extracellular solute-binding protein [Thermosphaera sp.]